MGRRTRPIIVAGVTVAVVAGGAGTAYAVMSPSGPDYRLATVTSAAVTAALHEVGTVQPVNQADVAFAVSGPVTDVAVTQGQHVAAGQRLGTLGTTALEADLTSAQSTLAAADLQVDHDLASEDAAAGSGTPSGSAALSSGSASPAASPAASLRPLQQAVLGAQRQADQDLASAKTALAQARQACGPAPSPGPAATGSAAPTTPATTTPSGAGGPGPVGVTGTSRAAGAARPSPSASQPSRPAPSPSSSASQCTAAANRVLSAEGRALQAQQALSGRLSALTTALTRAIAAAGQKSGGNGAAHGGGSSGSSGGGGTGSGSRGTGGTAGGGAGSPVGAAQLAADQASADAAADQVTVARQNLAAATLVSPIGGTVVAVDVTPGSAASAGSTAFVVAGLDRYEVVTSVPVTDLPQLRVGQQASVQADGRSGRLAGSVVSIGLEPSGSGSPATYSVTIGLTGAPSGLHVGGYADVTITTAHGTGVSVPTSAVHGSGTAATVTVYAGGHARTTKVTVGTRGPEMTRITSGLRAGQQVVLANLNEPLPTNSLLNGGPGPGIGGARTVIVGPGQPRPVG